MSHDHHQSAQIRSEPVPPCSYTTSGTILNFSPASIRDVRIRRCEYEADVITCV